MWFWKNICPNSLLQMCINNRVGKYLFTFVQYLAIMERLIHLLSKSTSKEYAHLYSCMYL